MCEDMRADYYAYIRDGARTAPPAEVLPGGGGDLRMPDPDPRPRRHTIRRADFDVRRFTAGCPECARMQTGVGNRRAHTTACRRRLEEAIAETEEGRERERVQAADERVNAWIARRIEQNNEEPQQEEQPLQQEGHQPAAQEAGQPAVHGAGQPVAQEAAMDIDTVGFTEIYAPERVAKYSAQYGMKTTFDLTTGWDFTQEDDRRRAWERVVSEQPQLIKGSPPCTAFSTLQCMNEAKWRKDEDRQKRRQQSWDEAVRHVNFCAKLYRHQIKHGFYFLHEHPHNARSWGLACMQKLMNTEGVIRIRSDMCMFGMATQDDAGRTMPVRKPTRFLTFAWGIADALDRRCDGGAQTSSIHCRKSPRCSHVSCAIVQGDLQRLQETYRRRGHELADYRQAAQEGVEQHHEEEWSVAQE